MKGIAILGSTGSIGRSTLDVVDAFADRFAVRALAAGRNVERLAAQVRRHRPALVAVADAEVAEALRSALGADAAGCRIDHGPDALVAVALADGVELVVSALVGAVGLEPTWAAVDAGRDVALANKEALVVAGALMTERAATRGARLLPVDSEHNALHQCLRGERPQEVRRLWLTASGGPFRGLDADALRHVTPAEALRHPTWSMGPKITIDSATLMNKGLEVIEARWLFDVPPERIRVVVHPTSVVHSMIELVDGSFKAQLGETDMRHPIQYALSWPDRWPTPREPFDPLAAGPLAFEAPDPVRFPCLELAFEALRLGGAAPAALNAANEEAVRAFLDERIGFTDIARVDGATMARHAADDARSIESLREVDRRARRSASETIEQLEQGVRP